MLFLERIDTGDEAMSLRIYSGRIGMGRRRRRVEVRARESDRTTILRPADSPFASRIGAALERGSMIGVILAPGGPVVVGGSTTTWQPADVRVVRDGAGRRAILVPVEGGSAADLPTGTYRLSLEIDRRRWETTEPADSLNRYADAAQLT